MNKSAFLHIIRHASSITAGEAEELEELVVNFPYCQTAHLLIAKAAHDRGSMLANQKLRKAAAYATDRQLLRKIIHAPAPAVSVLEEVSVPYLVPPELEWVPLDHKQKVEENSINDDGFATENPAYVADEASSEAISASGEEVSGAADDTSLSLLTSEEQETPVAGEPETLLHALETDTSGPVELAEDLDGLLYIDRIFPFRHVTPEHLPAIPEGMAIGNIINFDENLSGVTDSASTLYPAASLEDPESDPTLIGFLLQPATAPSPTMEWAPAEAPITLEGWLAEEPLDWREGETLPGALENIEESGPAEAEPTDAEVTSETAAAGPAVVPANQALPVDLFAQIYAQNQLGYAMHSTRLGECLEVKQELTSSFPSQFYPDLILEYLQEHEMEIEEPVQVDSVLDHQINLINQFLKLSPRLKQFGDARVRTEPQEDLSFKSSKIKKSLASENLATIFLKQGKVKKAIKIYEHLITKFPEKKAYFADQIEKLKHLT